MRYYQKPRRPRSRAKWIVSLIIVFMIGLIIGYGLGSAGTSQTVTITLSQTTSAIQTLSGESSGVNVMNSTDLLQTILNDIPTEYRVLKIAKQPTSNFTGFINGANMSLAKSGEMEATKARISLYIFDSPNNALNHAQKLINLIKEKRGYKDLTSELKYEKCFAWGIESLTASQSNAVCTKENYYIFVQITSTLPLELAKDELATLMNAIYKNLP